ncbi:GDP dissociation inhibitor [Xylariaceae sp. FL1272]|nr:GDP dissociation inhibitor [Xylariaceae sp. FL1272]
MMESLDEKTWDVIICGTGLPQSLLALALSRSSKRVLHLDANDFYGEHVAALTLQEANAWAQKHTATDVTPLPGGDANSLQPGQSGEALATSGCTNEHVESASANEDTNLNHSTSASQAPFPIFQNVSIWKHPDAEAQGLSFPRAYSLALAPQIIHTRSRLLSQLVSSRAYRQVEFLAVGSFFVYDATDTVSGAQLVRIPSSREDVFAAQSIPSRSKRSLMKFLKFVADFDSEEQKPVWQDKAHKPLAEFISEEFKLDGALQNSVLALTLTLDGQVSVQNGLATIHRHLTSIGLFGPGFAAVYPKWGGISEIAQVGCRAGAVGGGIYMLDTKSSVTKTSKDDEIALSLANGISVRTTTLVDSRQNSTSSRKIARLVAVVKASLVSLFGTLVEGAPTPAVAVVSFPSGALSTSTEYESDVPIYAFIHSSDTGECPAGQCVIYLTTLASSQAKNILDTALDALVKTTEPSATSLYKLYYEQTASSYEFVNTSRGNASLLTFPSPSLNLSFDDTCLDDVKKAWRLIMKEDASNEEYMVFEDREGADADDDGTYDL